MYREAYGYYASSALNTQCSRADVDCGILEVASILFFYPNSLT